MPLGKNIIRVPVKLTDGQWELLYGGPVMVASPKLLEASCNTIEQLKLVNALCFVRAYVEGGSRAE
jgi:hypothetical protein